MLEVVQRVAQGGRGLEWLSGPPIAHRGLHDASSGAPENTIRAFSAAIARGLPIECDVMLTSDNEVIVFHDHKLARLTGLPGDVNRMTLHDMQRLRIKSTDERAPSLAETLDFVAGRVPLLVEIKSQRRPGQLEVGVLRALRAYHGPVAVQSFSPHSMQWFRENAPEIPRGQLSGSYRWERHPGAITRWAYRHLLMLGISRPDFVAHEVSCLELPAVRLWRRFGGPLLAWTAKTATAYAAAKRVADGVIFEGFDPIPSLAMPDASPLLRTA
ncbi:MAG: glycerophosphodiester phosphodiesterase family protein [Bauldia sp.]